MHNPPEENLPSPQVARNMMVRPFPSAAQFQRRPAAAAESDAGISPRRILDAIRFSWKWALPTGVVLGTTACAVVYLLFEPQFQATAWLRIEENTPYLAFEAKDEQSKGFVFTQIELLRSPMVLGPVVADPDANSVGEISRQDSPLDWLGKKIAIKAIGNSELYTVSYSASNPKTAAHVVNSVLDSYFHLRSKEHGQRLERVIDILDTERGSRLQEVEKFRKEVRDLAKDVTGKDPFQNIAEPASKDTKSLADLASRLVLAEVEESVLRAKLQVLEGLDPQQTVPVPDALIDEISLIGPPARIRDRLQAWQDIARKNWVGSLVLVGADVGAMRVIAEAVL